MDKNAIKKYAIWARRELIERVAQRAVMYGITEKDHGDPEAESVDGRLLSQVEKRQRKALIQKIAEKGYQQVIEEVAYTWFNRFAALRFMEVNGYLPTHIRVFTNDANEFKPQILSEAIHLELEGLNRNRVYELENENKREELFKYLLTVQCNALNEILPGMFQKIEDYTELLLPDNLLRQGSVIEQMITMIPEADWTDQVQIIGWLYQYYNTEPKDKVFADLKKNIKITKENIPAATQLFTPDWIVHYMVENSLGRLWLEGHPNDALKSQWKYYLDEAEQEPEVQAQLNEIRKEYASLKPEEIKVIDPCMGSGHILCVLFDVLVQIYEDYGYSAREAAVSIVENNLWGLDIDDRAAQLTYFAVMMKARQYDRRFFSRNVQPHIYVIEESNGIDSVTFNDMGIDTSENEYRKAITQIMKLIEEFHDAKEYGSILKITEADWNFLRRFAILRREMESKQFSINIHGGVDVALRLQSLINLGQTLSQQYHVVVTNPPYMGDKGMSPKLNNYVKTYFTNTKSDLYATFIVRCNQMTMKYGFQSMITQHGWMFLSSFEKMRSAMMSNDVINMLHLGPRAFDEIAGEVVQSVCFTLRTTNIDNYKALYFRLLKGNSEKAKEDLFLRKQGIYVSAKKRYRLIDGFPYAYWINNNLLKAFSTGTKLGELAFPCQGMATTNNDLFLKLWFEVSYTDIKFDAESEEDTIGNKYFPYNKGGEFRKWYGNNEYVVFFRNKGEDVCKYIDSHSKVNHKGRVINRDKYFKENFTWGALASNLSCRYSPKGFIFDTKGSSCFSYNKDKLFYYLGFMNSKVCSEILTLLAPTLDFNCGTLAKTPILFSETHFDEINRLVYSTIEISKNDWDFFETSWNFREHPFIWNSKGLWDVTCTEANIHYFYGNLPKVSSPLELCWLLWQGECCERFNQLKANEEELNRIFIDIYGLQDELTPEVAEKDVTVRKADLQRDIRSFISYAVGCMFGRYSLDKEGLIFAGGDWKSACAPDSPIASCLLPTASYPPDKDNVLPICDDEYFEDDIVGRFVKFVEKVYGKDSLEDNLRFIADALGGKGAARDVIRNYFLNDFYADHLKVYQKRPIYWLFDSGKKNGFKCLIYMHRYQPDTIARIRTDYIHEQQSRYRTAIADLEQRISGASTSERVKLSKQLTKLQDQAEELRVYEEKIHHLADQMIKIDLDDGVKVNYAKFQDVLAPIK